MPGDRKFALIIATLALGLKACSAVSPPSEPDPDALATSVSGTLTGVPTVALPPEATATLVPPSPTEATATPQAEPTTAVPSPTETPSLTQTAGPTATLPAGDVRDALGNPAWRDPFTSGDNWTLGEDAFTRARVEDGELRLTGLTTTDGWRLTWPVVLDFYLEMTVRTGTCTGNDHYGLMMRVPDRSAADRGYLMAFTCDGRYSLRAWDGETMTALVAPTTSSLIKAGSEKVNRIGLWAQGDQLRLYANGTLLTQINDSTFTKEGSFGIFVGARQTDNFRIFVDEIAYWNVP